MNEPAGSDSMDAEEGGGPPDLLVVAHGERGGAGEDRFARILAGRLAATGRYRRVAVGFIRSEPSLEEAARRLSARRLVVYPLFMSDGYYVRQAIPERLGIGPAGRDGTGRAVRVAAPLGLDETLPGLVADLAARAAARAGLDRSAAHLLLVAHGSSKGPESAAAARRVAARVAALVPFASVTTAFLEEAPFLDETLRTVPGPVVLLGLFAGEGMHAAEDLPAALARAGRRDAILADPLIADDRLIERIVAALAAS